MEKVISPEERIRRAEEIYNRRRTQGVRVSTTSVSVTGNSGLNKSQKMVMQIIVCIIIFCVLWFVKGSNNVFSENVINQTQNILNYDVNIRNLYNQCVEYFKGFNNIIKLDGNSFENNADDNIEKMQENEEIQGITEPNEGTQDQQETQEFQDEQNKSENQNNIDENNSQSENSNNQTDEIDAEKISEEINNIPKQEENQIASNDGTLQAKIDAQNKTQMQQDAEFIKANCNLIHPIEGRITSRFGSREETEIISAFHQGIDISAVTGTPIHAAMEGTVVASSYAGDYGNHIKVQNGEVLTVYAHCSKLEVKVGDYVTQGQEIGKVGATGKVTGAHLHFEFRRNGRYVDPELIMNF